LICANMFLLGFFRIIVKVYYILGRRYKSFMHLGTIQAFHSPWKNVQYLWIEQSMLKIDHSNVPKITNLGF